MSTITVNVVHTLDPSIVSLLQALFAGRDSAPAALPAPAREVKTPDAAPAPQPDTSPDTTGITFDQVHKALLELKTKKKAAAVRDVLGAFDCKTVQDIPDVKYAEVLQMVNSELEG